MCRNFNWDAFAAISTAVGSLATAGAFIYTFKELRLKSNEKIAISMGADYAINGVGDTSYIGVSVTNKGYMPTTVKYIGFTSKRQKKKKSRFVFTPYSKNYNQAINAHQEEFYLLSTKDSFSDGITEDINKGYYKNNEHIYVCVVTHMKAHFKRTKFKFSEFNKDIH